METLRKLKKRICERFLKLHSKGGKSPFFLCYNERTMKDKKQIVIYIGFVINALLFGSKIWIAYVSGSHTMMADAVNNFSDILATIIMFVGILLALKPADKHHPYGHERYELIGGFLVAILMLYLGVDLVRSNLSTPRLVVFNINILYIAVLSIVLKGILWFVYKKSYEETKAPILVAGISDSRNDVILSLAIVLGVILQFSLSFNIDRIMGLIISIIIIVDALKMIRGYMSLLVGERPNRETIHVIERIIKAHDLVLGYHDLVIHEYGSRHGYASVHVSVDSTMSLTDAHHITESIEAAVFIQTKLQCVVHIDPFDSSDARLISVRGILNTILGIESCFESYHDIRIKDGVLYIEFVVVSGCESSDQELFELVLSYLKKTGYILELEFDRNYLLS